jgi:hypothetical protein
LKFATEVHLGDCFQVAFALELGALSWWHRLR